MTYEKDIAKAVDGYIEMERKAKAFDQMHAELQQFPPAHQISVRKIIEVFNQALEQVK